MYGTGYSEYEDYYQFEESGQQKNNPAYAVPGPPVNAPNNPYYPYVDYYLLINGRNRRYIHRCGIEDYFRKRLFDGINLNPNVNMEQYYAIIITYVKGVYQEIISSGIFYPHMNADMSAKLIIKRVLKTIIGELETGKVMTLWELNKCNQCLRSG